MIDGNRSCVDSAVHDVFAVVAASSHLQHTNVRFSLGSQFQDLGLEDLLRVAKRLLASLETLGSF